MLKSESNEKKYQKCFAVRRVLGAWLPGRFARVNDAMKRFAPRFNILRMHPDSSGLEGDRCLRKHELGHIERCAEGVEHTHSRISALGEPEIGAGLIHGSGT